MIIFRRKSFFESKIFKSAIGVFYFLFLKLPMTRRVQVCRVGVLNNTCVGCHCGSEAGGGGFESGYRPNFLRLFRYSLTRFYFLKTKSKVFHDKNWFFFGKWACFFLKKLPRFQRNWNKWFFSTCFWKFEKKNRFSWKAPKKVNNL